FPKSISLGDRAVAWVESEVDEWMEVCLHQR
ncbi:AlpA family phage regulatory protein, partial [Vibrio parahaemolyticus]|nr:AlpA family phage regulatory protein [Vibrio parahaemolyticus]